MKSVKATEEQIEWSVINSQEIREAWNERMPECAHDNNQDIRPFGFLDNGQFIWMCEPCNAGIKLNTDITTDENIAKGMKNIIDSWDFK